MFVDLDDLMPARRPSAERVTTLVAGFAAKLGERMGAAVPSDGAVTLNIPISDRTEDETRANAVALPNQH